MNKEDEFYNVDAVQYAQLAEEPFQLDENYLIQPDQQHIMAYVEGADDIESIEESEDLEALSDEDAGDYSNCHSQEYSDQWRVSNQPFEAQPNQMAFDHPQDFIELAENQ